MEFHEKLQNLRRQRGLTQEELAQALYVSRTAVSKWESGRGFPNIDSLKAIAAFFSVSVDELLSGDALLTMAEAEGRQRASRIRGLVLGLLDCGMSLLLFLPLFGQRSGETVQAVSLLFLTAVQPYLKTVFLRQSFCRCCWAFCRWRCKAAAPRGGAPVRSGSRWG